MSIVVTEMQYGKRIQADEEIEIVAKVEWERMNSALAELERQLKGTLDLVRNAHKYGLVNDDRSLDYGKFIIYDSVNKGMNLADTKKRVFESESGRDERSITLEYNRYTVKRAVTKGWGVQKIFEYVKGKGSSIEMGVVAKYVEQFNGKRGQS